MFKTFVTVLIFGVLIGLSSAIYLLGLDYIQEFHQTNTIYPYFMILVFTAIILVKQNTLYFPKTVRAVVDASETEQKYWSKFSFAWNLMGSWLSHLVGASLGREGTAIVLSSSIAQLCKLNWMYFKPVIFSATLAGVFGQPLVALIVIIEMFKTNLEQKLYTLIMGWIAVLILQSLDINFLFLEIAVNLSNSFLDKLYVAGFIGASIGIIGRFYKQGYVFLSKYFLIHRYFAAAIVLILSGLLLWPETRPVHSLSLDTWDLILQGHVEVQFVLLKLVLTLGFVSLGFIGGDLVPTVIIGAAVGVLISKLFNVDYTFGLTMGILAFFTAVSRLKWTSMGLIFLVAGFAPMTWAYFSLSLARYISGPLNLYRKI